MQDIVRMILEDEKLFYPKEAFDMDPLSRIDYIKKRREELVKKLDNQSKLDVDKLKSEVASDFKNYKTIFTNEFEDSVNSANKNFTAKVNYNLSQFEKELKKTMEDIKKPIDLLDGDNDKAFKHQKITHLFDIKEYIRNDLEYEENNREEIKNNEKYKNMYAIENFITNNETENPTVSLNANTIKAKGCKIKIKEIFSKVFNKEFWQKIKVKFVKT